MCLCPRLIHLEMNNFMGGRRGRWMKMEENLLKEAPTSLEGAGKYLFPSIALFLLVSSPFELISLGSFFSRLVRKFSTFPPCSFLLDKWSLHISKVSSFEKKRKSRKTCHSCRVRARSAAPFVRTSRHPATGGRGEKNNWWADSHTNTGRSRLAGPRFLSYLEIELIARGGKRMILGMDGRVHPLDCVGLIPKIRLLFFVFLLICFHALLPFLLHLFNFSDSGKMSRAIKGSRRNFLEKRENLNLEKLENSRNQKFRSSRLREPKISTGYELQTLSYSTPRVHVKFSILNLELKNHTLEQFLEMLWAKTRKFSLCHKLSKNSSLIYGSLLLLLFYPNMILLHTWALSRCSHTHFTQKSLICEVTLHSFPVFFDFDFPVIFRWLMAHKTFPLTTLLWFVPVGGSQLSSHTHPLQFCSNLNAIQDSLFSARQKLRGENGTRRIVLAHLLKPPPWPYCIFERLGSAPYSVGREAFISILALSSAHSASSAPAPFRVHEFPF